MDDRERCMDREICRSRCAGWFLYNILYSRVFFNEIFIQMITLQPKYNIIIGDSRRTQIKRSSFGFIAFVFRTSLTDYVLSLYCVFS